MSKKKWVTDEGYQIVKCDGCGANPCRDDGTERRGTGNFMRTCESCGARRCRICLSDGAAICTIHQEVT